MSKPIQAECVYYALFEYDRESKKTPVYVRTRAFGCYLPLSRLKCTRGHNKGKVILYLLPKGENQPNNAPSMKLQAVKSINFTGLKDCFTLSGCAYGYPNGEKTYSSKKTPNPFYEHRNDGYLFLFHHLEEEPLQGADNKVIPSCFELLVFEGAKPVIASYCQQMKLGQFNALLRECRNRARLCSGVEAERVATVGKGKGCKELPNLATI